MTRTNTFVDALVSSQRSLELACADDTFGFLIGSGEVEAVLYDASGENKKRKGELHASWVLEGRGVQDLSSFRVEPIDIPAFRSKATDKRPR
jgi:hypothetical protein